MGKGILSGVFWGSLTGGSVLAVLSLYAPLPGETPATPAPQPEAEAPAVQAPVAAPAPEPETNPVIEESQQETLPKPSAPAAPEADAAVEQAEAATPNQDVPVDAVNVPENSAFNRERDDTTPVAPADVSVVDPAAPSAVPDADATAPDGPAIVAEEIDKPDVPTELAAAPEAPAAADGADIALGANPAATTEAEADAPSGLALPQIDDAAPAEVNSPGPQTTASTQILTPPASGTDESALAPQTVSADTPIGVPAPQIENPATGVVTNRLPSVTAPSQESGEAAAETATDAAEATPETEQAAADPNTRAWESFAAPLEDEAALDGNVMSVVLIDEGDDGLPAEELAALEVPVSIAIDPSSDGAAERANAYRAAGIEVLALLQDLPATASPSDIEVAMTGYFNVLDQAVAIMDPLDARIQANRTLLQPVLGVIRESGHGLVTYDRGLNSAQQAARREGIPTATVFRLLDGEAESASRIKRYLARAAFSANQDGSVVVVGRSYPETVKAVLEWALDARDGSVTMVPVSGIMKKQDLG